MFASLPRCQRRLIDSQPFGQLLLCQPMNPPIFPNFISQVLCLFLKRITAQELDNLWYLGQRWLDPVPLPEIDRDIVNIKPEGKSALGELQVEPSDPDPVAPGPAKIRVFLPGNRLFRL